MIFMKYFIWSIMEQLSKHGYPGRSHLFISITPTGFRKTIRVHYATGGAPLRGWLLDNVLQ